MLRRGIAHDRFDLGHQLIESQRAIVTHNFEEVFSKEAVRISIKRGLGLLASSNRRALISGASSAARVNSKGFYRLFLRRKGLARQTYRPRQAFLRRRHIPVMQYIEGMTLAQRATPASQRINLATNNQ